MLQAAHGLRVEREREISCKSETGTAGISETHRTTNTEITSTVEGSMPGSHGSNTGRLVREHIVYLHLLFTSGEKCKKFIRKH